MPENSIWIDMDTPTLNEILSIIRELASKHYLYILNEEPEFILTFRKGPAGTTFAKCEPLPNKFADYIEGDLFLWVDGFLWNEANRETRVAMIDHALAHITPAPNNKYKAVKPEIHEFADVLGRHGFWNPVLQRAQKRINKFQPELFNVTEYSKDSNITGRALKVGKTEEFESRDGSNKMTLLVENNKHVIETSNDKDPLFSQARVVIHEMEMITSANLQRYLRIGFARASRLLENLAEEGFLTGATDGRLTVSEAAAKEWEAIKELHKNGVEISGAQNAVDLARELENIGSDIGGSAEMYTGVA